MTIDGRLWTPTTFPVGEAMKNLCCVLLLSAIGCDKPVAPPPPTQFQNDLAKFSAEARRFSNQVSLGMPEADQAQQAQKLRTLLAGLHPIGVSENAKFIVAKNLTRELELNAREGLLLSRMKQAAPTNENDNTVSTLQRSFDNRQTDIESLFDTLTKTKAD